MPPRIQGALVFIIPFSRQWRQYENSCSSLHRHLEKQVIQGLQLGLKAIVYFWPDFTRGCGGLIATLCGGKTSAISHPAEPAVKIAMLSPRLSRWGWGEHLVSGVISLSVKSPWIPADPQATWVGAALPLGL